MKGKLALFCSFILLCLAMFAPIHAQTKTTIKVSGADAMYGRISGLSKLYVKEHPDLDVTIAKGLLVDEGMKALIDQSADVAMASRKITDQEMKAAESKGVKVVENLIGYGGIVIITDPANSVDEVTIEQVGKVFKGEVKNWSQVGGKDQAITVVRTGEKHPGTLAFVEQDLLGGVPVTKDALVVPDFPTAMAKVAETPGSITFTRIRDPFESDAGRAAKIKPLKIKKDPASPSVMPSRASVSDGTYPLKRPYYLYTTSTAKKEVLGLVDFIVKKGWGEQNLTYMWQ